MKTDKADFVTDEFEISFVVILERKSILKSTRIKGEYHFVPHSDIIVGEN